MVSMVSEEQREQYFEQGFFIADDAIEPDMLEQLVAAAEWACAKIRSGAVMVEADGVKVGGGEEVSDAGNIDGVGSFMFHA